MCIKSTLLLLVQVFFDDHVFKIKIEESVWGLGDAKTSRWISRTIYTSLMKKGCNCDEVGL